MERWVLLKVFIVTAQSPLGITLTEVGDASYFNYEKEDGEVLKDIAW